MRAFVVMVVVGAFVPACFRSARPEPSVVYAAPRAGSPEPPRTASSTELDAVLEAARSQVGRTRVEVNGRAFHDDCSGFVRAAFSAIGVDVFALSPEMPDANGVTLIRAFVDRYGALHEGALPTPGDVVFFNNTWDRNHDGRLDDALTHVGLVDEVLPDGTFLVIHRSNRGVVRDPMNVLHPGEHRDEAGREINAYLRPKTRRDAAGTPHLMGELFAGFGALGVPVNPGGPRFDEITPPPLDEDDLPLPPIPPPEP